LSRVSGKTASARFWPSPSRGYGERCDVPPSLCGTQDGGLRGVRLVTSDNHKGLTAAIDRHIQGASWQRCQVHFARDLVKMVGTGRRGEIEADVREIFAATTRE